MYYGLLDSLRLHRRQEVCERLLEANEAGTLDKELIDELIMGNWPRGEKIAHKDIKLYFISQEEGRAKLVSHVYDITYGVVKEKDCLVCIDDSIVRGTTLQGVDPQNPKPHQATKDRDRLNAADPLS